MKPVIVKRKIEGRFHLTLRKATGEVKQELEFDNHITNAGLRAIVTSSLGTGYAYVGNGTSVPSDSDTKLSGSSWWWTAEGSGTSSTVSNRTVLPYWTETKTKRTFNPGIATGVLTEIGMGPNQAGTTHIRTLIKDANGNPTSITKLADDFLDVVYTLRSYVPSEDIAFNVGINGTEVSGFMRPLRFFSSAYHAWQPFIVFPSFSYSTYASTGLLPAIHSDSQSSLMGSGAITSAATESTSVNDAANYKKRYTATWNPDKGNVTIKSIYMSDTWENGRATYGIQFNAPIVKTATQRFRFSFDMIVNRG